ncbi:MAG: hypothetical protein V1646_03240 [bacterium]
MVSNKIFALVALSLVLTTASYAEKSDEQTPVSNAGSLTRSAYSLAAYPFKKAGNTVYYSAKTVAQILKALKPAGLATLEAGKLALYLGVIAAAVYGIGAATQSSYPDNYSAQFYHYAKPIAQQAGLKLAELQHLIN